MNYFCENPECLCPGVVEDSSQRFKCQKCTSVYYCSKACQKAHWKTHKTVCRPVEQLTIFDSIEMSRHCSLIARIGPHAHPDVYGKTVRQKKQLSQLYECIGRLPKNDRYRLSCKCNKRIHNKKLENWQLSYIFWYDWLYIDVGLQCMDKACRDGLPLKPLLRLYRPLNVKKHQIYIIRPFLDCVSAPKGKTLAELFNGDCEDLDANVTFLSTKEKGRNGMINYFHRLVIAGKTEKGFDQFEIIGGL